MFQISSSVYDEASCADKRFSFLLILAFCTLLINSGCSTTPVTNTADMQTTISDSEIAERFDLTLSQVERLHTMRGLTNEDIASLPPSKLTRSLKKIDKPKPSYPGEYAAWRLESFKDEKGIVAPDGLINAMNQVKQLNVPASRRIWGKAPLPDSQILPLTAGIDKDSWTWLVQVVSGMAILLLASIHFWVVLTTWPIEASLSIHRVGQWPYLVFYLLLLFLGD